MREGWEYKRWADVLTIINGKNQKAVESPNGQYPIYGSGGIMGYALDWLCPENCVIIGRKGNINKPLFVESKFWNVDTAFGLSANQECLIPKYLFYFCLDYNFERHNRAVTIPSLTKIDLLKVKMLVPPKPTQLSIVSELDKLNELIRIKKEQLKDYDTLAQSIFYEMFGDPVVNDKKWEVKQLKDVSTLLNGRAYKQHELLDKGKYKVLRVGNFFTNSTFYYSDLELDDDKYCEYGDLLFAWSASFGAFIWNGDKVIYHYHIWKVLFDKDCLNIQYYRYLLNTMTSFFMNDVHGIGMVHLTKSGMEQYDLPIPPLSLQHSFAHKIEQIERQKAAVQRTIKDLETLLAVRMQYWFE